MFEFKALARRSGGSIADTDFEVKECCGVKALFTNTILDDLDSENAVEIQITPNLEIKEYMADSRYSSWWRKPFFGDNFDDFPEESQLLILKLADDSFCVIVPVVSEEYKCVLTKSKKKNSFSARVYSGYSGMGECRGLAFVYSVGENPYNLVNNCVKAALEILNSDTKLLESRIYPEIFEYLGWCSWDSMQIRVCEEGIIQKCEEFKEKSIPVKWAIFDDMWAEVHNFYGKEYTDFATMLKIMKSSPLDSFEADPKRFPEGLSHTIKKVNEYGIDVGMWYPTIGYWKGIAPESEAYEMLKDSLIKREDGYFIPDWQEEKAYNYYQKINKFLKNAGAEFIKVDRQSNCELDYKGLAPIGKVARQYHDALEKSAEETFDGKMINCMGMASEDIWSRKSSPVSRCSDDFQPENREWFAKHITQCAYNSVLQGQFYWCDWDMWWTDDSQAIKNSVMRAVSGGPIYVSDKIGRSRTEILKPLHLNDGRILKCDRCAVPTVDCITTDCTVSGKAIKIQNVAGAHGIMAVLNIDRENKSVTASISGQMIDGFAAQEYAVYEHFFGELRVLKGDESFEVCLENNDDFKLYIFAPITDGFAVIGRVDKFISPKTIKSVKDKDFELVENGPCAYIENGKLVIAEELK